MFFLLKIIGCLFTVACVLFPLKRINGMTTVPYLFVSLPMYAMLRSIGVLWVPAYKFRLHLQKSYICKNLRKLSHYRQPTKCVNFAS